MSLAAFLSCLAFDPAVYADNIGVNFVGGSFLGGIPQPLGATEVAGYAPQRFWNNGSSYSGTVSLHGDAGAGIAVDYSGCSATWAAGIETWATKLTDTGGDTRLMKGYLQSYGATSGSNVVTISGLPVQLTSHGYAVIVYFDSDNTSAFGGADKLSKFALSASSYGTKTVFGRDAANVNFSGLFKQVPNSSTADLGAATPDGNMVIFTGLTDSSFTLAVYGGSASDGTPDGALNGLQIVPLSALPGGLAAPVINSPASATGTVSVAFSYTITANNNPTGFGVIGLPAGLSLNPSSGVISGTPTVPGFYSLTLSATNSSGTGTSLMTLDVGSGFSGNLVNSGTTNNLTGGSLIDITSALIAGTNGTLLATTNSGQTWYPIDLGLTNSFMCVRAIGSYEFVAGTYGLISMSPDFGLHWMSSSLGLTNTLYSMSFLTPFSGYAVGSGGLICFWNGAQWVVQPSGNTADFYSVYAIDSTAYAVGGGGTICRFNGTNWTTLTGGATNVTFYDVAFWNGSFGYAVGSSGAIYQTTNGGTTWLALNSGTSVNLRGIRLADTNTAWAVGDNGVLLLTTDAGAHWTIISLGTLANFSGIDFMNGLGLIFGDGGFEYLFHQIGYAFNYSPWISLTAPASSSTFYVCSKIPFATAAYDPDGYIAKTELFLGSLKLTEQTVSPLGYSWTNETHLGTYTCVAKATDNLGATAFSTPVTLAIVMPPGEQLRALTFWPTNAFEFCVCGQTGQVYAVQSSTNLTTWTPWQTVTNQTGVLPLIDAAVANRPDKFYRALRQ